MNVENALQKLKDEFDENINSHVFLVETNDIEKAITDLKDLLSDVIAKDNEIAQRQIKNETYLELIVLRSEGKIIKNDRVLELQNRIKTKPLLGEKIAYIIAPAEDMNESASNKLLKTIEEPQPNIVGFLVTKNRDLLLPTIKSRCETVILLYNANPDISDLNEDICAITKKLIEAIEKKNHVDFYKIKTSSKIDRENAILIENLIKDYYNKACDLRTTSVLDGDIVEFIKKNNSYSTIVKKAKYLNLFFNKLSKNMNTDLLLEKIFFDLKEVK